MSPASAQGGPEQPPQPDPRWRLAPRTGLFLACLLAVLAVTAVGQLVRFDVTVERPGPVQDTLGRLDGHPVVAIEGTRTYPTDGTLDFTTVSVSGGPGQTVGLWEYLRARTDRDAVIEPLPKDDTTTREQARRRSAVQMTGSQLAAEVVAVRAAGGTVGETLLVGEVAPGTPAVGRLQVRDHVLAVNGRPADTLARLHAVMDGVRPGSSVTVRLRRAGRTIDVPVATRARPGDGRAVMGVILAPQYRLPYRVTVDAGDVGGPSAGMMFALAIYDKLTPGALNGGQEVAGTGTIDADGTVGPIGGIRLKMIGAARSGARWFLAPADNCAEVRGHVPDGLRVVKVASFDEARRGVDLLGRGRGATLPTC